MLLKAFIPYRIFLSKWTNGLISFSLVMSRLMETMKIMDTSLYCCMQLKCINIGGEANNLEQQCWDQKVANVILLLVVCPDSTVVCCFYSTDCGCPDTMQIGWYQVLYQRYIYLSFSLYPFIKSNNQVMIIELKGIVKSDLLILNFHISAA